jgi:hypothetical protein
MSAEGQAVAARRVTCTMCDGHGILDHPYDNDSWAYCPACKGNGAALDGFFFAEFVRGPGEAPHQWITGRRASGAPRKKRTGRDSNDRLPSLRAVPVPEVFRRLPHRHKRRPTGTKAMGDGPEARRHLQSFRPGAWLKSPYTGWIWAKWPNGQVGWVPREVELPTELEVFPYKGHPPPGG